MLNLAHGVYGAAADLIMMHREPTPPQLSPTFANISQLPPYGPRFSTFPPSKLRAVYSCNPAMEFPRVLFQLDSGSTFSYELGYEQVSDVDLVALVKVTREALLSLETEIKKRKITTADTKAIRSLRDNFKTIETRERLDDAGQQFVLKGIDAVKSPLSAKPGTKRYQEFLSDIFRLEHRALFLLCAATFSKERIRTMTRSERLDTLIYLKANKTKFDSTILDDLAVQYGVPNYDGMHILNESLNLVSDLAFKSISLQKHAIMPTNQHASGD